GILFRFHGQASLPMSPKASYYHDTSPSRKLQSHQWMLPGNLLPDWFALFLFLLVRTFLEVSPALDSVIPCLLPVLFRLPLSFTLPFLLVHPLLLPPFFCHLCLELFASP